MNDSSLDIRVVGDVMLGRRIAAERSDAYPALLAPGVRAALAQAHWCFANLECPICVRARPVVPHGFCAPPEALEALHPFHLVSLANNHIDNCGEAGLEETMSLLDRAGVRHVGVGASAEEAYRAAEFEHDGRRLAVFGASTRRLLVRSQVGRYTIATIEASCLEAAVAAEAARGVLTMLLVHAGDEYVGYPPPWLRERVGHLFRCGLTIAVTHHPHVLGGWDQPGPGRLAWYSLGDFLFDSGVPPRQRSGILAIRFAGGNLVDHRLIPTQAGDGFQVRLAAPAVAERIHRQVARVSARLRQPGYTQRYAWLRWSSFFDYQSRRLMHTLRKEGVASAARLLRRHCSTVMRLALRSRRHKDGQDHPAS